MKLVVHTVGSLVTGAAGIAAITEVADLFYKTVIFGLTVAVLSYRLKRERKNNN